jgi:hypothetical protein
MAGVELINTYQIIITSFFLESSVTRHFSTIRYFTYTNLNLFYFWNKKNNYNSKNINYGYNPLNQAYSLLIYYFVVSVIIILIFLIFLLRINLTKKLSQLKINLYNKLLFPMTMAFLFIIFSN